MKIAVLISRILLGLVFLVFGLNGFLHFIPAPMPLGIAGQFFGALFVSRYYTVIFFVQVLGGLLLLVNRYVPFALTILGSVLVNVLCFHIFMMHTGIVMALIATALWFVVFFSVRKAFSGIVLARA